MKANYILIDLIGFRLKKDYEAFPKDDFQTSTDIMVKSQFLGEKHI